MDVKPIESHKTVPVWVKADVDESVAGLVQYLQTLPGVRTHASCQGTVNYRPQVQVSWDKPLTYYDLQYEFDMSRPDGYPLNELSSWAYVHPKGNDLSRYPYLKERR